MAVNNYLTKGNEKLHKSILGWSITPVKSCLNCKGCAKDCYALGPYHRWPDVKAAWDRNFELAKADNFKADVIGQIKRSRTCKAVRIHVAGDFFSQEYINTWAEIVKTCPEKRFYGYTKVMHMFDFETLVNLPNMNLINSIARDGKINFGDETRVKELQDMGYRVCPATIPGNDVVCGGDGCTLCQEYDKVCFHIH